MWRSSFFCKTSHQSVFSRTENRSGSVGRTYADDTSRGSPAVFTSSLSLAFLLDCLISVRHIAEVPGEDWRIVVHALLFVVYRAPTARERGNRFWSFQVRRCCKNLFFPRGRSRPPAFLAFYALLFAETLDIVALRLVRKEKLAEAMLSPLFLSLSHARMMVLLLFFFSSFKSRNVEAFRQRAHFSI